MNSICSHLGHFSQRFSGASLRDDQRAELGADEIGQPIHGARYATNGRSGQEIARRAWLSYDLTQFQGRRNWPRHIRSARCSEADGRRGRDDAARRRSCRRCFGIRSRRPLRSCRQRRRASAQRRRPHADGPGLPAQRAGTFPDGPRPARRRVEQKGPPGRGADGSRAGRERPAGRRRRPHPGARSALSGLRAGCQLRCALAEGERLDLERRRLEARRLRILERRSCRGASGDAPARSALHVHSPGLGADRRRHRRLGGDALAGQQRFGAPRQCGCGARTNR